MLLINRFHIFFWYYFSTVTREMAKLVVPIVFLFYEPYEIYYWSVSVSVLDDGLIGLIYRGRKYYNYDLNVRWRIVMSKIKNYRPLTQFSVRKYVHFWYPSDDEASDRILICWLRKIVIIFKALLHLMSLTVPSNSKNRADRHCRIV